MALAFLLAAVLGLLILRAVLFPLRNPSSPPCIRSWIPWFGAAFQFGKAPLEFIEQARSKYGPVFTIFALGKRFTFVTEEEGTEAFFNSKDLNFEQAVQQAVENAEAFYQNHGTLYSMMKGKMGPSNLHMFTGTLCKELHEHMAPLGMEGTGDLNDLVRHVMYPAVVNTLFGKGSCPTSQNEIKEFEEHFQKYDEDFEYASQMPECFLRNWSKSKKWLLKLFEKVVSHAERTNPSETASKTLLQHLLDNLQGKHLAPNYGLLMLWASQANAVPIAFWTLAFILSYPSIYEKIMEELASVFGKAGKDKIEVSEEGLKKLPLIKWCTLEAIRLRSPGAITKKVINPIKIQNFIIPAGDMLMLSPYWLHRNPKYFPDPEMFKPDRWKEANLEKNAFLDSFVAFGGGKHQCPGRWFAIMEIQLFVVLFLYKYEFVLLDAVPKESPLHLVGTQQPTAPFRVQYKCRE
ncbi:24-hydroxycholesterol 7-alpha-hydroxylase isoform X2 [Dryobates pubescens]|uniref:24-hydroxycholesterol 7-alpha-hydroxylase isoform X2 n=1 Tax=Dryobates pubescens TaxID=118200 RepID=UPI0023B9EC0B|nr:24-hydroxycholesterol 7-alpha-hydroxylase isoform X2 [Dryobates pubescens]